MSLANSVDGPAQNVITLNELNLHRNHKLTRQEIEQLLAVYEDARGIDLTNLDLTRLDLTRLDLTRARFADSTFYTSNLTGSMLSGCDLRRASFYDANLDSVDLYLADLESANLIGASLRMANLNNANLLNARLPDDIEKALGGSLLQENEATYEKYLAQLADRVNSSSIMRRRQLRYIEAGNIYRAMKNNLLSSGRYDEASWAYVRERQARRNALAPWRSISIYDAQRSRGDHLVRGSALSFWGTSTGKWIADWIAEITCGYGEYPARVIGWAFVTIVLFALAFWQSNNIQGAKSLLDYLNYSLASFTTIGFERLQAMTPIAEMLTSLEALLGIAWLALLMFVLGNRINRS